VPLHVDCVQVSSERQEVAGQRFQVGLLAAHVKRRQSRLKFFLKLELHWHENGSQFCLIFFQYRENH
jgi:hypothetical protein